MFFLFKSIGLIILFILKSSYYTLLLIYRIFILLFKIIRFLFTNKILRVPTILLILGLIFHINFSILSTMYFIYLVHNIALYKGIYNSICTNIKKFINEVKINSNIKDILKSLPASDIVLSNISLENDERTLNIYHLAITPNGLYNIIPLSSFLDTNYSKEDANSLIYDIYNETENIKNLLVDIIEEDVPLTTLILSPESDIENTINIDTFKLIEENQLPFIINSSENVNTPLDIDTVKELIIENKAWFLDKILMRFTYFIDNNKKILSFFMLCPIIYCIYMIILTILYSAITIVISDFFKFITEIL
ncbi:Uncharacterised protein [uncultured Clostridium sp.]|nr:Uncharacterised protein [uncultured Clostridium sp.]